MSTEPRRVRYANVIRKLKGSPKTTREIAKALKVHYKTAREYLLELRMMGAIELYTKGSSKPHKYYVPLRKENEHT